MNIKITGINGYLGTVISKELTNKGHMVSGIDRKYLLYEPVEMLENEIKDCDAVINLSGAPILQRWTRKNKKIIYNSRIQTTKRLVQAINNLKPEYRPGKFISASAIGIYKTGLTHDESSTNFDDGFLGKTVIDWEESLIYVPKEVQMTIFRIGLVLGKNAITIKKLLPFFKYGLGGRISSGKQSFPFIHEKDVVRAFLLALENPDITGVLNLVAPEKITNSVFTSALAKKLNRPAFFMVPLFILKIIYGRAARLLTESPVIDPNALIKAGFQFEHPTIDSALNEILN